MNFFAFNLKVTLCYALMLGGLLNVHAAECGTAQLSTSSSLQLNSKAAKKPLTLHQGMFELREICRVSTIHSPLLPLKANIDPTLKYININVLKNDCEDKLKALTTDWMLPSYNIGIYSMINLSSIPITFAQHEISPATCSIFAGGYDKYSSSIPFCRDNPLLLSLNMQDYIGSEDSFSILEEVPTFYPDTSSHLAVVFGDASLDEQILAKEQILGRYYRYALKPEYLYERKHAFPGLSRYLNDPQLFEEEIEGKQAVFTYTQLVR